MRRHWAASGRARVSCCYPLRDIQRPGRAVLAVLRAGELVPSHQQPACVPAVVDEAHHQRKDDVSDSQRQEGQDDVHGQRSEEAQPVAAAQCGEDAEEEGGPGEAVESVLLDAGCLVTQCDLGCHDDFP
ncbi:MAG: hypothetical protein [Bacteriophage sp.]|nr:MAG: hypothetical protein [Bacteriophage sp.]